MRCTLSADINTCPFYDKEMECKNKKSCSFQEKEESDMPIKNSYIRKERWYEKYYRK